MKVTIPVSQKNTKTLFTLLEEQNIILPHPCNRQGKCGECRVLTDTNGEQLACTWIPKTSTTVDIPDKYFNHSPQISTVSNFIRHNTNLSKTVLLIDLGSTTIAMVQLLPDGSIGHKATFANPNKDYGTDVIARLKSSCDGHREAMQKQLQDELKKQWKYFPNQTITACYIAGNTTMIHLLMGYPCDTLAVYPFTPYKLDEIRLTYQSCPVFILPGISSFVGGDITAGLFSLHFEERDDTCLFLDLGTNGELALLHKHQITVASVAAGPAFEGGNLSCGCQGIPGAITEVSLGGLRPRLTTIGNKLPVGLCGTGALSITAELLTKNYITKDGIILDTFPEDGILLGKSISGTNLLFTRDDFRQVQLALASVKAGILSLLKENNLPYDKINTIYIAGGFGYSLPVKTAFTLGIINPSFKGNIKSIGNSCLSGLNRFAGENSSFSNLIKKLISSTKELSLAENEYYKKELIHCMTFY